MTVGSNLPPAQWELDLAEAADRIDQLEAEPIPTFYEAKVNTDLSEGRGSLRTIGSFTDEYEALEFGRRRNVQGCDAAVWRIETAVVDGIVRQRMSEIYGRKQIKPNRWGDGWLDGRDERAGGCGE
jgi:hypothetical protein